ncbi:MAG TPA: S8 family serine peptidase [Actinomycetota bacterium]|nr:S8 family serine peptidase [Actinomycetota bacterium]
MAGTLALLASVCIVPHAHAVAAGAGDPRVVVAVIDSGINPYHEFFNEGGSLYRSTKPASVTPAVLKELGIDKNHIIRLTRTGDFAKDFARDKKQFDGIKKGEPYWFEGTNVIGISFEEDSWLRPDGNASAHGIGTAGAVLRANPEAIVIAVEGMASQDAEEWAFSQPAVDIISTSYGPFTSYPTFTNLSNSYTGVVENGKAHFGAAANDPSWSSLDQTSGPWWTIGIAGFEEGSSGGRQMSSGNVPDFVGDFTQELPYCRSCEEGLREVRGTSFATPRAAGTFSRILLTARRAAGHAGGIVTQGDRGPLLVSGQFSFTVWDMRRALEEAAYYPASGEYSMEDPDLGAVPIVDAAPWVQTGWGLISPIADYEVIKETLAHLGLAGKSKRSKPQAACDYMTANMEARHAYWDRIAVNGQSFGTSEDPYIYC